MCLVSFNKYMNMYIVFIVNIVILILNWNMGEKELDNILMRVLLSRVYFIYNK